MAVQPGHAQHGFLFRLFATIFGSDDPEWKKERALKLLEKDLKRIRPRFYLPSPGLVEPALARLFHEIYRTVAPAQLILQGAETSGALRLIAVEASLSEEQKQLREQLSDATLAMRAKVTDGAALAEQVRQELRRFTELFDPETTREVDARWNRLGVLLDLIAYDYWFLLRKFDPGFPERDLGYKPAFRSASAAGCLDELKDFLEVLPLVDPQADWDPVLNILKEYKSVEVVPREGMRRVLQLIRDVQRSGVLLGMVRHIDGNPAYRPMLKAHRERIVRPYLAKLRGQAELTVQRLAQSRTNERSAELARAVFGAEKVPQLANYSDEANATFTGRMLGGFLHIAALANVRTFLADVLKRQLRELVDLLLIKGKWSSNQPSQQMSEAFHELLKIAEAIPKFDASLAEDGETGRRVRSTLVRLDKDRRVLADLRPLLQSINDEARGMVTGSVTHCIGLAKILKLVYDDSARPHPELVVNWRELQAGTDRNLRALIAGLYRRIFAYVQLMQSCCR